jgi:hypothetical protein
MNRPLLAKKVSIERAIIELSLSDMSLIGALRTIQLYAEYDGLNIYFDETVIGSKSDTPIGEQFTYSTGTANDGTEYKITDFDYMACVGSNDLIELGANKKLVISYQILEINGEYQFSVSLLSQDGVDYFIPSQDQISTIALELPIEDFYFDRDEFLAFNNRLQTPSLKNQQDDNKVSAPMKALALLARDLAENSQKFKNGNNVNASAVKKHLLALAESHHQQGNAYSTGGANNGNRLSIGLKSIDDSLNKALDDLDLKIILPKVPSSNP